MTSKDRDKLRIPPTAFERVVLAMRDATDIVEKTLREKHVVENLERFDVARDLLLASDHLRIASWAVREALRKAATLQADGDPS